MVPQTFVSKFKLHDTSYSFICENLNKYIQTDTTLSNKNSNEKKMKSTLNAKYVLTQ